MGTPNNYNQTGCDPISSNCVIWQGRDLPCINVCTNDSISTVIYDIAVELCKLIDMFDLSTYDLTCLACPNPKDIRELIQLLVTKVCELEACCDATTPINANGCPDCVVNIASCFYYQNPLGDTVTTMQLQDYVTAIGNKLCTLFQQGNNNVQAIEVLDVRVEALENAPPPEFNLPLVVPTGPWLPNVPTPMNIDLQAVDEALNELQIATGNPNAIYTGISAQPAGLNNSPALGPQGGIMASIPGWEDNVQNGAQSLNNLWLTVGDIRNAIINIKATCCNNGCEGINLSIQAAMSGTNVQLFVNGSIPAGFLECSNSGTIFKIQDSNGAYINQTLSLFGILNNPGGVSIPTASTPINPVLDLTISSTVCLINADTGAQCESVITYNLINTLPCPSPVSMIGITPTSIQFGFTSSAGSLTYDVDLYDATGTTLIATQSFSTTSAAPVSGTFALLSPSTTYKMRIRVTAGGNTSTCSFITATTMPSSCTPPAGVAAIIVVNAPMISLGAACGFGVLAGSTVTNTGTTTINGNLGLDPGSSVTGAPTVTGVSHINDAAAIAAKVDLALAYTEAETATNATNMSGTDLGGLTLTPGVYEFDSSALITGTLTLDGPGVYIFQIGSTLTTDGGTDVLLINGATADTVFWQVGSSATLGTNSTFEGILMALASITIDGGTVNGALMAQTGAVTFSAGTVVNYIGCP